MSDLHPLPLLAHDLQWPQIKARVYRDACTGAWCWEHQCANRLPDKPFHGLVEARWEDAYRKADFHVRCGI